MSFFEYLGIVFVMSIAIVIAAAVLIGCCDAFTDPLFDEAMDRYESRGMK